MLFLGCDAGSTKTEMLISDERGNVLAHEISSPCNYLMVDREFFGQSMRGKIESILKSANVSHDAITYSVYGMPSYGEVREMEQSVPQLLGEYAPPMHSKITNDAVIGFVGSLGGQPGIHVVAGTGSIVYGEDMMRNIVRVGGWSLLFDDEGSSSWIARQTLSLFFRQADGRIPSGPLMDVFREHYHLDRFPLYFVGDQLSKLNNDRKALAQVQMLAKEAAERGDETVQELYCQAVTKLLDMVLAASRQLACSPGMVLPVSYYGGLFKNESLVLEPFRRILTSMGFNISKPLYSPVVGAIAIGARQDLDASMLKRALSKVEKGIHGKGLCA